MIKQKLKVFEASTVRKAFEKCLKAGHRPLTAIETLSAIAKGKVTEQIYDSATVDVLENDIVVDVRDATAADLEDIRKGKNKVWPWYVDHLYTGSRAYGNCHLDSGSGRLVGVCKTKRGNTK